MKRSLLLAGILIACRTFSQCPFSVALASSGGNCAGATLTVNTANPLSQIIWYKDGLPVSTVTGNSNPLITTVAGGNGLGHASNQAGRPMGIYVDGAGNVYFCDAFNYCVQKWTPGATSGTIVAGGNGSGGAANQISFPTGLFVDANMNLYIVDQGDGVSRIQKWAPGATSGITVAGGNGNGPAPNQLDNPEDVFVDPSGNVYVADLTNHRVQKWAPGATSGITVAGGNGEGSAPNQLSYPNSVCVDGNGNVYVSDQNGRVQKWAPGATSGITVAGGNGPGGAANQLYNPYHIYVDGSGNIYIADFVNARIQKWAPGATSGVTVAGGNGPGSAANQLEYPDFFYIDGSGNIYVSDQYNYRVQKWGAQSTIDPTYPATSPGTYTAVATDNNHCSVTTNAVVIDQAAATLSNTGTNCLGSAMLQVNTGNTLSQIVWQKDGGDVNTVLATNTTTGLNGATVAGGYGIGTALNQFLDLEQVFVDGMGNIYITDIGNERVVKWTPGATSGVIVAGGNGPGSSPDKLGNPTGIFVDGGGNVYVSDGNNNRVQKWAPGATSGITVAGTGIQGPAPDQLDGPRGVFVDGGGNIYVVDAYNNRVQKWAPGATSGVTVAGGNGLGPAPNQLHSPESIYVDANGNIYISDWNNNRVQKWAPGATSGVTVAGGNGQGSALNQLNDAYGLSVDAAGNVFVVDASNHRVMKWAPGATSGVIVAGGNGPGGAANQFDIPVGLYMDANGNLYIADQNNRRIQKWPQQLIIDKNYQPVAPGTYKAIATTYGGCTVPTGDIVVLPLVTPSVTIDASATAVCAGTPVTFTATPLNGGAAPIYQWKVNGGNAGTNSDTYTNAALPTGASISCTMTSNAVCATTPSAASTPIALTVTPPVNPTVTIQASAGAVCTGELVSFKASSTNGGGAPAFPWQITGNPTGSNSPDFQSNTLSNGDLINCVLTSNALCATAPTASSNTLPITVNAGVAPVVVITADLSATCQGDPVHFTARITNGVPVSQYQWEVNGTNAGINTFRFTAMNPSDGDIVTCLAKGSSGCAASVSNSIPLTVHPMPVIAPGQLFQISQGQGITLDPIISGNIASWSWTPSAGLSDDAIRNPIANPQRTTDYTLEVATADDCRATGTITVKVFTQLRIPNAFTPNSDGHNDIFYVLGGPPGSAVKDLSIFDRWGQKIFQVHDAPPGDPGFGWNGYVRGTPAPTGTYVYNIVIRFADGKQQLFSGTLVLTR